MDRDNKWDRIELATDAIIFAKGEKFADALVGIEHNYSQNITDEFVKPFIVEGFTGINDGDGLIFANFRADRARQISQKLFDLRKFSQALALTEYSKDLNNFIKFYFRTKK